MQLIHENPILLDNQKTTAKVIEKPKCSPKRDLLGECNSEDKKIKEDPDPIRPPGHAAAWIGAAKRVNRERKPENH